MHWDRSYSIHLSHARRACTKEWRFSIISSLGVEIRNHVLRITCAQVLPWALGLKSIRDKTIQSPTTVLCCDGGNDERNKGPRKACGHNT